MSFNDDRDEMGFVGIEVLCCIHVCRSRPIRIPQKMLKDVAGRAQTAALPPARSISYTQPHETIREEKLRKTEPLLLV